jgi:hypothetical protein
MNNDLGLYWHISSNRCAAALCKATITAKVTMSRVMHGSEMAAPAKRCGSNRCCWPAVAVAPRAPLRQVERVVS